MVEVSQVKVSSEFLKHSRYCDHNNPVFNRVRLRFQHLSSSQRDLAVKLFTFVRDRTLYSVGNWDRTASETFLEKRGTCTNNANLFVALCRSFNIPAGYGILEVVGPEYFGPVILPHFAVVVSKKSKHIFSYVHLGGRWIKCDPSDDKLLSINTQHINPPSKLINWNGRDHAVLNINKNHIISETGPLPDIDHLMCKKQRLSIFFHVKLANMYISFLRSHGAKIKRLDQLHNSFILWLKSRNILYYGFYMLFIVFPYKFFSIRRNHLRKC